MVLTKNAHLTTKTTKIITVLLLLVFGLVLAFYFDLAYTAVNMIFGIIILLLAYRYNPGLLSSFYLTFLVMLIPFFIVNGILTGTGIENEVVWYNNDENLGIRMLTIPIEDSVFAFSLILLNLLLFKKLKQFDV
jgi:lycopene cyclase domain-containing protein